MRTITLTMIATLALATLGIVSPAIAETDSGICTDQTQVVAIPGAGEIGLWANDCIVTGDEEVAITFTSTDALPHQAAAAGCFDSGAMGVGRSSTVSLRLVGDSVYNGFKKCSTTAVAARDGTFIVPNPLADKNLSGPVVVPNEDGSVTVHYICAIHGAAMHGTITLGAPAA